MPIERRSELSPSPDDRVVRRVRWVQRLTDRFGLTLELLLAIAGLIGVAVGTVVLLAIGFGAQRPGGPPTSWQAFGVGALLVGLLGLLGLGAVAVLNTIAPVLGVDEAGVTIDFDRVLERPHWYQLWQAGKALSGAAVLLVTAVTVVAMLGLVLSQAVSTGWIPLEEANSFVSTVLLLFSPLYLFVPVLVLGVFAQLLGRVGRILLALV